ncbi:MAG: WecB/TagA/CpsF family glycosyltransferase [Bacillaceae bacterium]
MKTVEILGIPFLNTTMNGMIDTLKNRVNKQEKTFVVTANPEIVMHALEDKQYEQILKEKADYVIADGIGVIRGAQLLGTPLPERVPGVEILANLLQFANEAGKSVYFVGAKPEVVEMAVANTKKTYPNVKIAGFHHGFFKDGEDGAILADIKEKQPDLVFVGLGFPRQERWIANAMEQCEKGIFMGVGGSIDILAGTVKRAPKVWQTLNIEWLYRLVKQPSRWRRMLVLPQFMMKVVKVKRG